MQQSFTFPLYKPRSQQNNMLSKKAKHTLEPDVVEVRNIQSALLYLVQ